MGEIGQIHKLRVVSPEKGVGISNTEKGKELPVYERRLQRHKDWEKNRKEASTPKEREEWLKHLTDKVSFSKTNHEKGDERFKNPMTGKDLSQNIGLGLAALGVASILSSSLPEKGYEPPTVAKEAPVARPNQEILGEIERRDPTDPVRQKLKDIVIERVSDTQKQNEKKLVAKIEV